MLMIRSKEKQTVKHMKLFFENAIMPIQKQSDKTIIEKAYLLYQTISRNYNIIVLTSDVNLGIARNRDRAINYISYNKTFFMARGLSHVLLLDDSDFIGFTKLFQLNVDHLYRQQIMSDPNSFSDRMFRPSSAAGYSYWHHLIPINRIELYYPLVADLSEDAITEAYLNTDITVKLKSKRRDKENYLNNCSISESYTDNLYTYKDNFVDYKSYLYETEPGNKKMSNNYNPPALYISDNKLCVCTTSGMIIPLNARMKRLLFTKYVFIIPLENGKFHIIAHGNKKERKFSDAVQKNLHKLIEPIKNIRHRYFISKTSSGLASYDDTIYIEKQLVEHRNNALYVSESLLCSDIGDNRPILTAYKIIDFDNEYNYLSDARDVNCYWCMNNENGKVQITYCLPPQVKIDLPI